MSRRKQKKIKFCLKPLAANLLLSLGLSTAALAGPQGGVIRAGTANIEYNGTQTQIQQSSERAVIDWRSFGVAPLESVIFNQPSRLSATLNRVTGDQISAIHGKITANGQVALINPNGIIFGAGAQINVGSLIASTANISNSNFMDGRLVFDQAGKPGASILNRGTISAAEGGLVALVAPTVRNDGIIQARLGKVVLGAGDTFTLDLYGDQLINLALAPEQATQLFDAEGKPVTSLIAQAGRIEADGGQVVLITAPTAKAVLDQVINMSGTIRADSIAEQNGRIVLLGAGGTVTVSGKLSAQGTQTGQRGGNIEVLGDHVTLAASANLDASGAAGGGTIHVGGAFQGGGDTYRAQNTDIAPGTRLSASATDTGNGGEVVVWSDQQTRFAGHIEARGGPQGGNGGQLEVSGKGTLEFLGTADASAAQGRAGALLLDPANVNFGLAEAALISRVLRTGTSTTVQASNNIDVNALIDGRGRIAGGGLTLTAGNNLNINEFIVTNNGAIHLNAGNTINVAADKAVFAGTAPITATSRGDLNTAPLITTGPVTYRSTGGSVFVNRPIDGFNHSVLINAAQAVTVNQPILNLQSGAPLDISAGGDIVVNAQIDGRGGVTGGVATLSAGGSVFLNNNIITNNGAININASTGTLIPASLATAPGLFAGNGAITIAVGSNLSTGVYATTGALSVRSTGGTVNIDTKIDETIGNATFQAAGAVNVNQAITNIRNGSHLALAAGSDIVVNQQIDALDDTATAATAVAGGTVTLSAGNNVVLNDNIATFNGPVNITARNGAVTFKPGTFFTGDGDAKRILSGNAPITITSGGDFSTGEAPPLGLIFPPPPSSIAINDYLTDSLKAWVTLVTTGKLTLRSTAGNVRIDAPIPLSTGEIVIDARDGVIVNQKVITNSQPITITAGLGGVTINALSQSYAAGPKIDAKNADLTIRSVGDINILDGSGVASNQTITLVSQGALLRGSIGNSSGGGRPQNVLLSADQGIGTSSTFDAGFATNIEAYSLNGNVSLAVSSPQRLRIGTGIDVSSCIATPSACVLNPNAFPTQGGSVNIGGFIGPDVVVVAGGPINIPNAKAGNLTLTSSQNIALSLLIVDQLAARAVGNVAFDLNTNGTAFLSGGPLSITSTTGNILLNGNSAVRLPTQQSLTLTATLGSVELSQVETDGLVSISAGQNITVFNNLGAESANGVGSLILNAGGNINTQGARATGIIDIDAIGTFTSNAKSIFSSAPGTPVTIDSIGSALQFAGSAFMGTMIDLPQRRFATLPQVLPAIAPGPQVARPAGPAAITAPPSNAPGNILVASLSVPDVSSDPSSNASVNNTSSTTSRFDEIIPDTSASAELEIQVAVSKEERAAAGPNPLLVETSAGQTVVFSGGRGVAQLADLGRGNVLSSPPDVFQLPTIAQPAGDCAESTDGYFQRGAFGSARQSGCGK